MKRTAFAIAFLVCAAILLIALGGCSVMQPQPLPRSTVEESATVAQTRRAIDEGYATVISLNGVISENVNARVWTKEHAQAYFDRSEKFREQLDTARALLRNGQVLDAKGQADLIRTGLQALQREVSVKK